MVDFFESIKTYYPQLSYRIAADYRYKKMVREKLPDYNEKIYNVDIKSSERRERELIKAVKISPYKGDDQSVSIKRLFRSAYTKCKNLAIESTPAYVTKEIIFSIRLRKCKEQAKKVLEEIQPISIFSYSDRTSDYLESSILSQAKKLGINVTLPYVANWAGEAAFKLRTDENGKIFPEFRASPYRSLYHFYSYFRLRTQILNKCYLFPPYILNAHKRNGTLSNYNWWVGNGCSDLVCVNSSYAKKTYLENKVPREKIQIVGDAAISEIYKSYTNSKVLKDNLCEKYNLDPNLKFVILTMPQQAEQGYLNWEKHWQDVNFLVKTLSSIDINLLISLHPRQNKNEYLFLKERFKAVIVDEPLSTTIGVADLFLASNSGTMIWSILCGVPTINFDFNLDFHLYDYLDSLIRVKDYETFNQQVKKLIFEQSQIDFTTDWYELSRDIVFCTDSLKDISKRIVESI